MSLFRRMNALIFEKASSIGLRSGEYAGRYSIRMPEVSETDEQIRVPELTKTISKC